MLKELIDAILNSFYNTGYFQKIYPLCQLVNHNGYTKPVHYVGGGSFEDVAFFSGNEGLGYFRLLNDITISEADIVKTRSCNPTMNQYTFDLSFVGCVPKDKTECDNEYADYEIINVLISAINNVSGVETAIGARSANVSVSKVNTVSSDIIKEEFGGDTMDFNYKYSLFSLSIKAVVIASPECFNAVCYG